MEYVGIDLGARQSHCARITEDGEIRHQRFPTTCAGLEKLFEGRGSSKVLVEASGRSEWVARWLEGRGHQVVVADPNYQPMYGQRTRRSKTDRRDAEALALACAKGHYRPAHRLSDEARLLRARVKVRKVLVRSRAKAVVVVRALLVPVGVEISSCSPEGFPKRFANTQVPEDLRPLLEPLVRTIEQLTVEIGKVDWQLEKLGKNDQEMQILMTMPGVGPVTAATWIGTLDNARRFKNAGELVSFLGLVPQEWSSSDVRYLGRITKAGPTELRDLLVEAAWNVMIRPSPEMQALRTWALEVARRRGRLKAVVALARHMAQVLYAMWRGNVPFDGRVPPRATAASAHA